MGYKISNDQMQNDRDCEIFKLRILTKDKLFFYLRFLFIFQNAIVNFKKFVIFLFGK